MVQSVSILCLFLQGFQLGTSSGDNPHVGTNSLKPGGGQGSGSYKYVDHGGKAVISSAEVHFTKNDLDKGSEPDDQVRKYARGLGDPNDDAGHIYANELGGFAVPINIFPQSPHINRGIYRSFEQQIYKCLKSGGAKEAILKWQFTYSSTSSTRPNGVTYQASFDAGCKDMKKQFDNPDSNVMLV